MTSGHEERERLAIRLRIERLRRQIDGRIRTIEHEALRLVTRPLFSRKYPGAGAMIAMAIGLVASARRGGGHLVRRLRLRFLRRFVRKMLPELWRDWKRVLDGVRRLPRSRAADETDGASDA